MAQYSPMETLLRGGRFFEGPRWHDGRWWVSDFFRRVVLAVEPDGRVEEVLRVETQPSGLGWLPDGSLLVVSMLDRRVLRRDAGGEVSVHAELGALCGGPANDMVVAADGRAYVGNFGYDFPEGEPAPAALVRVEPDGTVAVAADGLRFPNGCAITPDGRMLLVCETFGGRITAFSLAPDGTLSARRTWADGDFTPDGCALDAEGRLWVADPGGSRCLLFAEGGSVEAEVRAPDGLRVYACMLGGDDGRTLLLCLAPGFRGRGDDAVLATTRVDVPRAGLP